MIFRLLSSVATVVLLGLTTVSAQTPVPGQGSQGGAAAQGSSQQAPGGSAQSGAAGARGSQGGGMTQGSPETAGQPDAGAGMQNAPKQSEQSMPGQRRPQGAQTEAEGNTEQGKSGEAAADAPRKRSGDRSASDGKPGSKTQSSETGSDKAGGKDQTARSERRDTKISTEERTVIKNTIVQTGVAPVRDIDVNISVGVAIPQTVVLHPLPPRIIEIVPAYSDFQYFVLADGRIVIVDPVSYEIVYVIA